MIWIAVAVGVAVLLVLVTGGSLKQLGRLPIQSVWLLLLGLAIQLVLEYVDVPKDRIDDLGFGLLMASYALLLAWCFVNLKITGMFLVTIGVALNALVIGLNQGMPTIDKEVRTASGRTVHRPVERSVKHRPERPDDLLPVLDDWIVVPGPSRQPVSIGDLAVAAGIVGVCVAGSRRPRRRRRRRRGRGRGTTPALVRERSPAGPPGATAPREAAARSGGDPDPLADELDQAYSRLSRRDAPRGRRPRGGERR